MEEAPRKRAAKQTCSKVSAPTVEEQPSAPSDWDTDDEEKAYGPNTKRARRAQQKKQRKAEGELALERLIADVAAKLKPSTRATGSGCEATEAAAAALAEAAGTNEVVQAPTSKAGQERAATLCNDKPPPAYPWPYCLENAPCRREQVTNRVRPTRSTGTASTKTALEAVQSLLGGKRNRHDSGEEPKAGKSLRAKSERA